MIDAVSNVNFRGDVAGSNDIINAPSKFSVQAPISDTPADSFEKAGTEESKKSGNGLAVAIGAAIAAIAIFAGLGYAVKNGKLEKVDLDKTEGFFNKAWARVKNAGVYIGEKANSCYETVAGWCGKEVKDAKDAKATTEAATEAAAETK